MKRFYLVIQGLVGLTLSSQVYAAEPLVAPEVATASQSATLAFPSMFGAPSAIPPIGGTGFVGVAYAAPTGNSGARTAANSVFGGYTVGNPITNLSLTVSMFVSSASALGDAGAFGVSAARLVRAGGQSATFAGISVANIASWGVYADAPTSFSGYVSHVVGVPTAKAEIPVQLVAGYGNDNTRRLDGSGALDDGFFAGVGVGLTPWLSGSVTFTQTQANIGGTVAVPDTRIGISMGFQDVTNNTGRRQFTASAVYTF